MLCFALSTFACGRRFAPPTAASQSGNPPGLPQPWPAADAGVGHDAPAAPAADAAVRGDRRVRDGADVQAPRDGPGADGGGEEIRPDGGVTRGWGTRRIPHLAADWILTPPLWDPCEAADQFLSLKYLSSSYFPFPFFVGSGKGLCTPMYIGPYTYGCILRLHMA